MKYILIIGDGMADMELDELGGMTPLEKARIPVMDSLASKGILGSVKNCPETLPPGSDTAILSIFGCDPLKYYSGRAPLEAAAQGISLNEGDLAFRCNMASIEDNDKPFGDKKIISHSSGSIDGRSSRELVEYLFKNPIFKAAADAADVSVSPGDSFRHIAIQAKGDGKGLVLKPPHDHLGEKVSDNLPAGNENAKTLAALMELSNKILSKHPINEMRRREGKLPCNCIWFWAEGTASELPSFEMRYGLKGAIISAVPLCKGIGTLMGMKVIEVDGATGVLQTNYEGKAEAAVKALLDGFDFVAVHIEAPDECSHDRDLEGKIKAIENIDSRVIAPVLKALEEKQMDFRMLILSDHRTLSTTGAHDGDPVPFILYDSVHDTGQGRKYTEKEAGDGPFLQNGTVLMDYLFEKEHFN
ncbi:MAG: cofactor-independent phosphoglycerate mutase [Clostridiales bacterium]|nr:cofactor-independent phosphoglycerate mutase [Clostridiales bacterium]